MTDNARSLQASASGEHPLPGLFSSGPMPAARRTSKRGRWIAAASAVGVVAIAATVGIVQATASAAYDDARTSFETAAAQERSATETLLATWQDADLLTKTASLIRATNDDALLSPEERKAMNDASARVKDVLVRTAPADADSTDSSTGTRPLLPWELIAEASRLRQEAATGDDRARTTRTAAAELGTALDSLRATVTSAATSASGRAAAAEAQYVSARTGDIIALRKAATTLAKAGETPDQATAAAFSGLAAAVAAARASQDAELAEKAGPLRQTRLEIEAFARSKAGGVLLDFDWAPEVNGYGGPGGIGGLTSWNAGDGTGGFATITLSDSVAEIWPSSGSRALVVHAISAKCFTLFDWQDRTANENWATAWAIGQGESEDANGVWLYGYPPQSLIDTAATCR